MSQDMLAKDGELVTLRREMEMLVTAQQHTIVGLRKQLASQNETMKTAATNAWKDKKVGNELIVAANRQAEEEAERARDEMNRAKDNVLLQEQEAKIITQAERAVAQAKIETVKK